MCQTTAACVSISLLAWRVLSLSCDSGALFIYFCGCFYVYLFVIVEGIESSLPWDNNSSREADKERTRAFLSLITLRACTWTLILCLIEFSNLCVYIFQ